MSAPSGRSPARPQRGSVLAEGSHWAGSAGSQAPIQAPAPHSRLLSAARCTGQLRLLARHLQEGSGCHQVGSRLPHGLPHDTAARCHPALGSGNQGHGHYQDPVRSPIWGCDQSTILVPHTPRLQFSISLWEGPSSAASLLPRLGPPHCSRAGLPLSGQEGSQPTAASLTPSMATTAAATKRMGVTHSPSRPVTGGACSAQPYLSSQQSSFLASVSHSSDSWK